MANHLKTLLEQWYPKRDELQWVLATIYETDGSSYRKPGAMMLINSLGQYSGILSGGCLESDIMRQSRQCWDTHCNRLIQYDMREEEDLAWQLGIGCGGMVKILLQPVSQANDYLSLLDVLQALLSHKALNYKQQLSPDAPFNEIEIFDQPVTLEQRRGLTSFVHKDNVLVTCVMPPPHLAVFGGGVDAVPVIEIASVLGWRITLIDPRPSYARRSAFADAENIVREPHHRLVNEPWLSTVDAALLMNHNIELDAASLELVKHTRIPYLGILGPKHRTERVVKRAGIDLQHVHGAIANPVGLRLGGDVPESLALSMLSEIHSFLAGTDGRSISDAL